MAAEILWGPTRSIRARSSMLVEDSGSAVARAASRYTSSAAVGPRMGDQYRRVASLAVCRTPSSEGGASRHGTSRSAGDDPVPAGGDPAPAAIGDWGGR